VLWILEFDAQETWLMTYLIVEVAQQSKARRKDDFLIAFSPVIAEATATAYKGATNEVQQKLRRVVEVWRQRQIFESPIQDAIEARIEGMSIQR
jgi:regulator of Ty1 transposition protein 103